MKKHIRSTLVLVVVGLFVLLINGLNESQATEPQRPSPQAIEAFTKSFFSKLPNYKPGDLITQSQIADLTRAMLKKEWVIGKQDYSQLMSRILDDNSFLVKELNTTNRGRTFLRKIKNYPGGIDRLDKIAQMPKGKRDVHAMIYKIPDGDRWIKGMTTTEHGRRMGESISHWQGDNFNKKTGRIYTVEQLTPELSKIVRLPPKLSKGVPLAQ